MSSGLSYLMSKLYWPFIGIFSFVLLVYVFLYFYQIDNWSDRGYYNWMNFKRIFILVGIIGGSVWMKYQENSPVGANLHLVPGLISSELGFLGFMGVLRYNLCFKYFCK
ncbi:MAG: hypothetical protein IPP06_12115 [Saprospiraceae bacterium]|nr:hypothetical protein [Candidatus Vicinibacter affinis]MBP6521768.1 hypothetical protein [Saprospiraceae bacterium]MBK6574095.1 hypothetical protein [Candidatus Vicinibacter affinis]MBK6823484.1 hypothetical protein [Candidatus Vicinibacter affinis]MBK7302341.1 hypothetical protein [Candidatus Vicinibacter affinis]